MSHMVKVNIIHNGHEYKKGAKIAKGAPGFDDLVKAGHAIPMGDASPEAVEESAQVEQPKKEDKKKKH